jgi:hypothetical protein
VRQASRDSLTAKVLCTAHNNLLSPVDQEAKKLIDALSAHILQAHPAYCQEVTIDGRLLERWCIKSGFNGLAAKTWTNTPFDAPSPVMVRMAFGLDPLPPGTGLYVVLYPDKPALRSPFDLVHWFPISEAATGVRAFYFRICSFNMVMAPEGPADALLKKLRADNAPRNIAEIDWQKVDLTLHPSFVDLAVASPDWEPGVEARLKINFSW